MMMENEKGNRSAVEMAIDRGIKCMIEPHIAAVPLQKLGPDSVLVHDGGRAGSRQKRLRAFIHAAEQILAAEVQGQFPELKGKTPVFYEGWLVGSEKSGAEVAAEVKAKTADMFRPADSSRGDYLHPT